MTLVSITQAKADLEDLIERVRTGEQIVITRRGKPIAEIIPDDSTPGGRRATGRRPI